MVVISIHGGLLHGKEAQDMHRETCKTTEAVQHKHYGGTDAKFNFGLSNSVKVLQVNDSNNNCN